MKHSLFHRTVWQCGLIFCLLLCGWTVPAHALVTQWKEQPHSASRLIIANEQPDGSIRAGLHITLKGAWKSYWRSPGDAGLPPRLTLANARNIEDVMLHFPAPTRYIESWGLQTYGYGKEIVYPITIMRKDRHAAASADITLDYMICEELCIPYTEQFRLMLPSPLPMDAASDALLRPFESRLPSNQPTIELHSPPQLVQAKEGWLLRSIWQGMSGDEMVDLFVESGDGFGFGAPEIASETEGEVVMLSPVMTTEPIASLSGSEAVLTLVAQAQVVEAASVIQISDDTSIAADGLGEGSYSFAMIILFAFLGGLILNVMPCVLPVLSLKLLSVVRHHDRPGHIRVGFVLSAVGVVLTFLLLALVAVLFQQAGIAVGWGVHFQQPVFIAIMALVMVFFALDVWGLFELRLPGFVMAGDGAVREAEQRHPMLGHVLTGMFATVLATPCTAPFLGTAVGVALSGTIAQTFLLFGVMGLGMAFPYLMVAAFPRAAYVLPKPGAWMERVKWAMGWLLFATVLWLVWIASSQLSLLWLWGLVTAILLLMIGMLIKVGWGQYWRRMILPLLLLIGLAAWCSGAARQDVALWQPFAPTQIAERVESGQVVFVDVTADWCLTCKANKFLVLDRAVVQEALLAENVVAMQADWTNHDESIGDYLRSHGRYGIPFNIVHGPGAPDGIILSELLTESAVLEALQQASGP